METIQKALAVMLPVMGVVFASFSVTGIATPVLPLHVHQELGLGTFVVGLIVGSQFAGAVACRVLAGRHADRLGARHAVATGLAAAAAGGLLYWLSLLFVDKPVLSATILLVGRAVTGGGESFIITGAQAWGLVLIGHQNTGKVIAWIGIALYTAFALGAPAGTTLYAGYGFSAIAMAAVLLPLVTLALVLQLRRPAVAPPARVRSGLGRVLAAVWLPGVGLALSTIGLGAVMAFVSLLFVARGWTVWPAFTVLAVALIVARVFFGHLADRIGGAKVALACVLIEAAGQALLWLAPSFALALVGVALTSIGYSLCYPALGAEAVRRAPPERRGLALGAYTVFFDVALAVASPALGVVAGFAGLDAVFLVSMFLVALGAVVAMKLLRSPGSAPEAVAVAKPALDERAR